MDQREIKFRAWIKNPDRKWKSRTIFNITNLDDYNEKRGYVLMQYTGLKDKNGKEIYEGDVVEWTDGDKSRGVVEWCQGDVCFDTNPTLNGLDGIRCKGYSIIGNIYENPELLKK